MMSAEAFVKYASRCYNKEFGKFKKQSNFIRTIISPKIVPPSMNITIMIAEQHISQTGLVLS